MILFRTTAKVSVMRQTDFYKRLMLCKTFLIFFKKKTLLCSILGPLSI